jgi:hypothetical protein
MRLARWLLLAAVAIALTGCGPAPVVTSEPASSPVALGVSNGTTLTVTIVVNGRKIADFPAGGPVPSIDPKALPPLPWHVEARSPSGRVLTSMDVKPEEVSDVGGNGSQGAFNRVYLSCGPLTISAGNVVPEGPVPLGSATPGDCAP